MPGMNASSAGAYGILAGPLFFALFLTGIISLITTAIVIYGMTVFGIRLNIGATLGKRPWMCNIDLSLTRRSRFLRTSFGLLWLIDGIFQLHPDMPGGFIQQVANPSLTGAPSWIISLADPLLTLWINQPINVDLVTAWIQVLIGLGLLVMPRGPARRLVLHLSLIWSLFIFIVGNGGGIFYPGAGWTSGAPSAIIVYGFVSIFLLSAESGREWVKSSRIIGYFLAAFLFIGGVLQALPFEGNWTTNGLAAMAKLMSQARQPAIISTALSTFAHVASANPIPANALMVFLPLSAAMAVLLFPTKKSAIYYLVGAEFIGWWLGMDFGIFTSTATDFNSGLPVILLASSMLKPGTPEVLAKVTTPNGAIGFASPDIPGRPDARVTRRNAIFTFPLVGTVLASVITLHSLLGPASPAMAKVDSGGVQTLPATKAPNFTLTNYNGQQVSLSSLAGRPVVLTFLDPVCYDTCPLYAQELVDADAQLGANRHRVALVAVVANPLFHTVADARTFTYANGLNKYKNWYYLSGSDAQLQSVWRNYGITVTVAKGAKVTHSQRFYFIDGSGTEKGVLVNTGNAQLANSYASTIYQEMKSLL